MDRVRLPFLLCIAISFLTLSDPCCVQADFTAYLTVETTMSDVKSQVRLVTYVKNEWRRRELHGEGLLQSYIGDHIEITHRSTGTRVRIYPESEEYEVDTVTGLLCGPFSAIDLNLLGRIGAGVRGTVESVDTAAVIQECPTLPVEILIESRYGGSTHVRFWMCESYEDVFGTAASVDLNCGSRDAADRATYIQAAVLSLQEQFRLSDEDAAVLKDHLNGYPMLVESYSQTGETIHSATTISTDSVIAGGLPDSLFVPPPGYRRR